VSEARRAKIELGVAIACSVVALGVALALAVETQRYGEERVLAESSMRVLAAAGEGENVHVLEPVAIDEAGSIDVRVDREAADGTLDLGLALVDVEGGDVYETALTSRMRSGGGEAAFGRVAEGTYALRVEGRFEPERGATATTARIQLVDAPSSPAIAVLFGAALLLPIPIAYARYRRATRPLAPPA
jgi:hypothetical protein